jgi:hypothetical protein
MGLSKADYVKAYSLRNPPIIMSHILTPKLSQMDWVMWGVRIGLRCQESNYLPSWSPILSVVEFDLKIKSECEESFQMGDSVKRPEISDCIEYGTIKPIIKS